MEHCFARVLVSGPLSCALRPVPAIYILWTPRADFLFPRYFQCGVSNFLLGRYETSLRDFDDALLYLRGNGDINYEQLGLKFKLYSAEVLFNKGLAHIYMGQVDQGLAELQEARKEKVTPEHSVIDDAIADRGDGYTVFSIVSPMRDPFAHALTGSAAARRRAVPPRRKEAQECKDEGLHGQGRAYIFRRPLLPC